MKLESLRTSLLVVGCALIAAPALGQATKPADRPAKPLTPIDMAIVNEAVNTVAKDATCEARYTITKDGKPKDIKPNCTDAGYDPYVVRAIESMTFQGEIFAGEAFDFEDAKQPFNFKAPVRSAKPAQPVNLVLKTPLEPKDIQRAQARVNQDGTCKVTYNIDVEGKPKDIVPNCTPDKYNPFILEAVSKMRYEPVMKNGAAVEMPNVEMPLNLTNDKKKADKGRGLRER